MSVFYNNNQSFNNSYVPLYFSFVVFSLFLWLTSKFHFHTFSFVSCLCLLVIGFFCWFNEVECEKLGGKHNSFIHKTISFGFMCFMLSEVCFFFGFFWSYFHTTFNYTVKISSFFLLEWDAPLINTILLLSSGFFLTLSHLSKKKEESWNMFDLCMFYGVVFVFIQFIEFFYCDLSINSKTTTSCFFLLTGFHGLHVFVGLCFFIGCEFCFFVSGHKMFQTKMFKYSAWYWHFVDVVWIFLFVFVYTYI